MLPAMNGAWRMTPLDDPDIPDLVSTTEAGEVLGISKQMVSHWYRKGVLPGQPVGRNVVFLRRKVEVLQELIAIVRGFGELPAEHVEAVATKDGGRVSGDQLAILCEAAKVVSSRNT